MKNSFKRVICAVLCLLMTLSALTAFSSCNDTEEAPTETNDPNAGKVSVVRALEEMEAGSKIERKYFEEVMVDPDSVPEGAYATIKEVVNKFLSVTVYAGDILVPDKVGKSLTDIVDEVDHAAEYEEYVIVTDYTKGISGDVSDAIQKAIDENPNKTIYFPEGKYNISKPIKTSADPTKCVSLRLATHAAIIAMDSKDWENGGALFMLGSKDEAQDVAADYFFIGGILQCETYCNAITVVSGDVLINNISIKKNIVGITIKEDARVHVDSSVVCGPGGAKYADTIGVLMEGEESTLTNMRMAGNRIGVKLTGSNNVLRNIHPLTGGNMMDSSAFWDASNGGNFYDNCYSDQFADSFRLEANATSIYIGCFAMWYQHDNGGTTEMPGGLHYGFKVNGQFNAVILNTRIALGSNQHATCDCTYLKVTEDGGDGVVAYPRLPGHANEVHPDEHFDEGLGKYYRAEIMG